MQAYNQSQSAPSPRASHGSISGTGAFVTCSFYLSSYWCIPPLWCSSMMSMWTIFANRTPQWCSMGGAGK
ncbi:hypothetical protein K505DRAFT_43702 [Melanomma pulvis-pyrius CBS 109.77]|uniref:Uncharacterized protein n=1 Tax=Melanomma pulvis-pyrius CBS 109.77 TaxID=1314802 RepID=A0A6A6XX46_9PLEO|nr:hypothetical protein K505DRAFT_43702 [Melanomma pulvis-pyrius CBS 109.77]